MPPRCASTMSRRKWVLGRPPGSNGSKRAPWASISSEEYGRRGTEDSGELAQREDPPPSHISLRHSLARSFRDGQQRFFERRAHLNMLGGRHDDELEFDRRILLGFLDVNRLDIH